MGGERTRKGKQLFLYFACCMIMPIGIAACVHFPKEWQGERRLTKARILFANGDYEGALRESRDVLSQFPQTLGDEALFQMGLVHAHPKNPKPDYRKSLECFQMVTEKSPKSSQEDEAGIWVSLYPKIDIKEQAHIWSAILEEIVIKDKEISKLSQKINLLEKSESNRKIIFLEKELRKRNENMDRLKRQVGRLRVQTNKLKGQIDRLKQIDLGIEEKKRKDMLQ